MVIEASASSCPQTSGPDTPQQFEDPTQKHYMVYIIYQYFSLVQSRDENSLLSNLVATPHASAPASLSYSQHPLPTALSKLRSRKRSVR